MKHSPILMFLCTSIILSACGGGDSPPPAVHTVSVQISGLPDATSLKVGLKDGSAESVAQNGSFTLAQKLADQAIYQVVVSEQPSGAYCNVKEGIGRAAQNVSGVLVECSTEAGAALFDTNRLQRLRLTISVDDWNAFVLNTYRSAYTHNAFGGSSWTLNSVSEVYRRGQLEYLADNGSVLSTVTDVGFRMRGNTSRLDPESWTYNANTETWEGKPRRFHINLKFDEDFADDESVYACVDSNGVPAAVATDTCRSAVADNIPEVVANKDRTFMGMESVALKYNKDDPTHLREVLSHAILNDQGVPAGRAAHASLELVITPSARSTTLFNRPLPQTYQMGVFAITEPVDKLLVQRLFAKNNYVFKVGGADLTRGDNANCVAYELGNHSYVNSNFCIMGVEQVDPLSRAEWLGNNASNTAIVNGPVNKGGATSQFAPYNPSYDLKTKKSDIAKARTALNTFIALLNAPGTTAADLEAVFDVDGFIRAQAVDIAIGAVDHYARVANNYYLYQHATTKKWIYIPYDYDFSFRDNHLPSWGYNAPFRDVAASTILQGSKAWRENRISGVNPKLFDLIFASPSNQAKLITAARQIEQKWFNWSGHLEPVASSWLAQIEPAITATTAAQPGSGDTIYKRAAALGNSYTYRSWVSEGSVESSQFAPNQEHDGIPSTDTLKRFVEKRKVALAPELAQ